ncbi:MAG: hypothetical protein MZV64_64515 [Ignavibacteriales bacterium]|nr:hypothetical protein [Ignavibacteriales bacterium]
MTIADPRHRHRLKELTRLREALLDHFLGVNAYGSTEKAWRAYFYAFWLCRIIEEAQGRMRSVMNMDPKYPPRRDPLRGLPQADGHLGLPAFEGGEHRPDEDQRDHPGQAQRHGGHRASRWPASSATRRSSGSISRPTTTWSRRSGRWRRT